MDRNYLVRIEQKANAGQIALLNNGTTFFDRGYKP
jgi:16S rRNA U516 pseudouridylate synthase RsuA-like enzyme